MICLFRHLSAITPLSGDYDTLPPPSDESLGADLARIKYYRNNIAHCLEDKRQMSDLEFHVRWESVCQVVYFLIVHNCILFHILAGIDMEHVNKNNH